MDQVFPPSIVILGPTASGKTRLACHVAFELQGGVISADSRQVYHGLDIGTGKDLGEYRVNGRPIPYYLLDYVRPGAPYDVAQFQADFYALLTDFPDQAAIVCGGSGLYLQAIIQGYTHFQYPVLPMLRAELSTQSYEDLHKRWTPPADFPVKVDVSTQKRLIRGFEMWENWKRGIELKAYPAWEPILFGLDLPREVRRQRITARLDVRLNEGLVDEVEGLLRQGVSGEWLRRLGLEYAWVMRWLAGELTYIEFRSGLEVAIHQMAKRQMTFFRSMEKKGAQIHWLDGQLPVEKLLSEIKNNIPQHLFP